MLPAVLNTREKVFRPQWEFSLSRKDSVASLSLSRGRRGDGILVSRLKRTSLCNLCGPLCLCGNSSSRQIHHRDTEGSQRGTEKIAGRSFFSRSLRNFALLLIIGTLISSSVSCSRRRGQNSSSITETREVTDEA